MHGKLPQAEIGRDVRNVLLQTPGLSTELKQKILRHKPTTIAQAQLIPGMTPAAIALLILLARKPELGYQL